MAIKRGSTPTHTFDVDVDLTAATIYISYSQGGKIVAEKTGTDLTVTETKITTQLTQAETLRFAEDKTVGIQIRYKQTDGTADVSDIIYVPVDRLLKEGII